jgi:acetyl-CoA C-acetyltransferase
VRFERAYIPVGFAWSSPFARWQGPLAEVNSIDLAVDVTNRALKERGLPSEESTDLVLGWTVPQKEIFYGAPTVAARIGAMGVTGPMISQACATSAACLQAAAANHEANADDGGVTLVVTTDRTSNGPLVTYPSPP